VGPAPNLSDVYVFKKIASTLSFTKAARQIGVSRSAVSKQLSRLEKDLGVTLVSRTTRSVSLTEAGRTFHARTSDVDTTIERAADLVRGADFSPLGTVAFALPSALGASLMPALTTQFQPRWPELRLNVEFQDQAVDIVSNSLDLAIQVSARLSDSNLISRRLVSTKKVLAASPRYLHKHGTPEKPADLEKHRCLGLASAVKTSGTWNFTLDDNTVSQPVTYAFSANSELALILAACLHSGIICVPEISIAGEIARNQLQVIRAFTVAEKFGVYALYPHRHAAAKVKVLVDFIEAALKKMESGDRWTPLG